MSNIRIKKADTVVSVDDVALFNGHEPAVCAGAFRVLSESPVARYVWEYGLRQILNDALAPYSQNGTASTQVASKRDMLAIVERKLETMYNGEVRVANGDATVEGLAYKIAAGMVINAWQKKNPDRKIGDFKNRHEATLKFMEANPGIMEAAKLQFAARDGLEDLV